MKVYLANNSRQTIGGGWTFLANFKKGCKDLDVEFVDSLEACDVMLIMSVSAVDRGEVARASQSGKKIVLRVDNIPKESRNKKSPADSMRMFGGLAHEVVYQSKWAQEYAGYLTKREGVVIYNGVDYDIFNKNGLQDGPESYLFVQYNQDENKRFPEVAYDFHMRHRKNKEISLTLVGLFPSGIMEKNFDFFDEERINYIPPIADRDALADLMRQHRYFYFPAYNDASPNSLGEAIACGCEPLLLNPSGGSLEVRNLHSDKKYSIQDMGKQYVEIFKKLMNEKL